MSLKDEFSQLLGLKAAPDPASKRSAKSPAKAGEKKVSQKKEAPKGKAPSNTAIKPSSPKAIENFKKVRSALVDQGATPEHIANSWKTPPTSDKIESLLMKEGVHQNQIAQAFARAIDASIYRPEINGKPVESGDGWIIADKQLWMKNPFDSKLRSTLYAERANGVYSFNGLGVLQTSSVTNESGPTDSVGDTQLDTVINLLLEGAIDEGVSDIHIAPRTENSLAIAFRVDGDLEFQHHDVSMEEYPAFCNRLITRAGGYGGSIIKPDSRKLIHPYNGRDIQIRLEARPVVCGGSNHYYFVLRILNASGNVRKLEEVGLERHHYQMIIEICQRTKGLFLVTGPTGSGKTTTLYGILQKIKELRPGDSVQTMEDPVEIEIPGIEQTAMNNEAGMTFATGTRSALRSDPEVILIGEIRDLETATQALLAAETGHLVLATLHTNSSAATISRLLSYGVEPVTLANALIGISAQRMVKKVCEHCGVEYDFHSEGDNAERYGTLRSAPKEGQMVLRSSNDGCEHCQKGYSGRHVVCEIMMIDPHTEDLIIQNKPASHIEKAHIKNGFEPLWGHGISLLRRKKTTLEQLESKLEKRAIFGDSFDYNVYYDASYSDNQ